MSQLTIISVSHSTMPLLMLGSIQLFLCKRRLGKIFVRIQEQKGKGEKMTGKICTGIFKKLKESIAWTQYLEVLWNGENGFEVKHINGRVRRYIVYPEKGTCSCGYF